MALVWIVSYPYHEEYVRQEVEGTVAGPDLAFQVNFRGMELCFPRNAAPIGKLPSELIGSEGHKAVLQELYQMAFQHDSLLNEMRVRITIRDDSTVFELESLGVKSSMPSPSARPITITLFFQYLLKDPSGWNYTVTLRHLEETSPWNDSMQKACGSCGCKPT